MKSPVSCLHCVTCLYYVFLVVEATLEMASRGQSVISVSLKSVTHFNFIIMTSYQHSLDALVYLNVLNG